VFYPNTQSNGFMQHPYALLPFLLSFNLVLAGPATILRLDSQEGLRTPFTAQAAVGPVHRTQPGQFLSNLRRVAAGPSYYMEEPASVLQLRIRNKLILVEGQANGQSGYFLFDTGASELILNQAYFPQYEGHNPGFYFADAIGNRNYYGYVHITQFGWGGLRREDFFAPRLDLLALEAALGEKVLGIIGYDVLQHVDLEVDYYQGTLTLWRPGTASSLPAPDYSFGFQMDGHFPVLRAKLGEADGLLLAIDSGSSVDVCASRHKLKLRSRVLQERTIGLQGAAGLIEDAPYFVMDSLQVEQAYCITPCRVALGNLEALGDYGFRIDGLLGVNFFRLGRVFFSYPSRRIAVWLEKNDYTLRHISLLPAEGLSAE